MQHSPSGSMHVPQLLPQSWSRTGATTPASLLRRVYLMSCRQGRSSPGSSAGASHHLLLSHAVFVPSPPCRLSNLSSIARRSPFHRCSTLLFHPRPSGPARLLWSPSSKLRPPNLGQWAGVHPFSLSDTSWPQRAPSQKQQMARLWCRVSSPRWHTAHGVEGKGLRTWSSAHAVLGAPPTLVRITCSKGTDLVSPAAHPQHRHPAG